MGTRVKQPDDFKRKNKSRWPWQGELSLAETIPWSLLNFLHFRCLSPYGGCRKAKYPNVWGGGSGTGQGTRCCRETLLAGRRMYGAPAAHLHLARCIYLLCMAREEREHTSCKQLAARPCFLGILRLNTPNCFCTRVKKHPPTSVGLWHMKAVGPRLASLPAKRLLKA